MITDTRIETLRTEAGEAGDTEQVALCDLAIDGDAEAARKCAATLDTDETMTERAALRKLAIAIDIEGTGDDRCLAEAIPVPLAQRLCVLVGDDRALWEPDHDDEDLAWVYLRAAE